jgi:IS30 family transposase
MSWSQAIGLREPAHRPGGTAQAAHFPWLMWPLFGVGNALWARPQSRSRAIASGARKHTRGTHQRTMRRSRYASTSGQPRGRIKDAVSIRKRPPGAEDRAVPGHWEGDLLAGAGNTHDVVTLVERSSRLVMLVVRVRGREARTPKASWGP